MNTTLFAVPGYKGAHIVLATRNTESGSISDVQLVGSLEPFSAPTGELTQYELGNAMTTGDPITLLAQEAATIYNLDPRRVQRAANIIRQHGNVQQARRDENDEQIKPSLSKIIVKGSKGWYLVHKEYCQCPDNAKGHTCKHRIAAWMYRECIVRPTAAARHVEPAIVLAELS